MAKEKHSCHFFPFIKKIKQATLLTHQLQSFCVEEIDDKNAKRNDWHLYFTTIQHGKRPRPTHTSGATVLIHGLLSMQLRTLVNPGHI